MSYHLSLDETAHPQEDVIIDVAGLPFVAEAHQVGLVSGMKVEVRKVFGREGLVASNARYDGEGC